MAESLPQVVQATLLRTRAVSPVIILGQGDLFKMEVQSLAGWCFHEPMASQVVAVVVGEARRHDTPNRGISNHTAASRCNRNGPLARDAWGKLAEDQSTARHRPRLLPCAQRGPLWHRMVGIRIGRARFKSPLSRSLPRKLTASQGSCQEPSASSAHRSPVKDDVDGDLLLL